MRSRGFSRFFAYAVPVADLMTASASVLTACQRFLSGSIVIVYRERWIVAQSVSVL